MRIYVVSQVDSGRWFADIAAATAYSLRQNGHDAIWQATNSLNDYKNKTEGIVLAVGAHCFRDFYKNLNLIYVGWEFEPLIGYNEYNERKRKSFEVYSKLYDYIAFSNEAATQYFKMSIMLNVFTMQLGYHPIFEFKKSNPQKDIDVLFYGSGSPRRDILLGKLRKSKLKVHSITSFQNYVDGSAKYQLIERSKVCINIHYVSSLFFDQHRIVKDYISNKAFTITETLSDKSRIQVIQIPYDQLVGAICDWAGKSQEERDKRALADYLTLKQYNNLDDEVKALNFLTER